MKHVEWGTPVFLLMVPCWRTTVLTHERKDIRQHTLHLPTPGSFTRVWWIRQHKQQWKMPIHVQQWFALGFNGSLRHYCIEQNVTSSGIVKHPSKHFMRCHLHPTICPSRFHSWRYFSLKNTLSQTRFCSICNWENCSIMVWTLSMNVNSAGQSDCWKLTHCGARAQGAARTARRPFWVLHA